MAPTNLLLKNGTVLIHDAADHIKAVQSDILITANKISKIATDISAPTSSDDTQVIDCTAKLISPGFIDTHHHLWQTQLKGRHADELLLDYMVTGNYQSSNFQPADFFWGQLGGCLEALAAGTTTVVDHAHVNYSPEASKAALAATVMSGIRSTFCYTPTPRVDGWNPMKPNAQLLEPWVLSTFAELAQAAPFGDNGRVQLGLAFDGFFLPKDAVVSLFEEAKELGVRVITAHYVRGVLNGDASLAELLSSYGLLDERILFSHATGATAEDARLIREAGARVSCTPSTELQMAQGTTVCYKEDVEELRAQCSLGIDCHSNNGASIPGEMRLALQTGRKDYNEKFVVQGKYPRRMKYTVEDAFNLGTVQGARAIGREGELGSIAEGKLADLVVFDAQSPALVCAVEQDAVAAVVLHSSPADIEMVIVDGQIRKADGKLEPSRADEGARKFTGQEEVEWKSVAEKLVETRRAFQERTKDLDFENAREVLMKMWYIDQSKIVDSV